jgi:hypothetical protein
MWIKNSNTDFFGRTSIRSPLLISFVPTNQVANG